VTFVATDQPPERPRFIALPPGSLGSIILHEFPEVAKASKVLQPSSHGMEHYISMKGLPIASKFRRLDAEKLQAAKAEFEQLEREGIVQRSTSPWASLNLVTEPDTYPLPNMLDFSARVAGCKVFSKIDLRKVYYQWRHFLRSMLCERPGGQSITPPSPPIREHAPSHSGRLLLHPCR
jgi:hypothetical protein